MQILQINQCVENICFHGYNKELSTWIRLYCRKDRDPKYVKDKGVSLVGQIEIPNSKEQHGKEILQSFYFEDTDIYLKITDKTTGETYHDLSLIHI